MQVKFDKGPLGNGSLFTGAEQVLIISDPEAISSAFIELEAAREKLALLEIFLSGDEELIESMTEAARARRPGGHQAADEAKEPAPAPAPPPRRRKPRSLTQIADFLCDGPGL